MRIDFQIGISQYEELNFTPVHNINEYQYKMMKIKEKKMLKVQAQIFGRDMLEK